MVAKACHSSRSRSESRIAVPTVEVKYSLTAWGDRMSARTVTLRGLSQGRITEVVAVRRSQNPGLATNALPRDSVPRVLLLNTTV